MSTRVLIVDDTRRVQCAPTTLLAEQHVIEVVGSAEDRRGAIALVERHEPDVMLLDVDLAHRGRGHDVPRDVHSRHPSVAVVMFANYGWAAMRQAFIEAGAAACFDKALEFGQAVDWVRTPARRRQPVRTGTATGR